MEGWEGDDWFRVWIHSFEVVNRAWWGLEGAGRRAGCEAVLAGAVRMMRQPWTGCASRMTLGGKLLANVLLAMVVMSGGVTAQAQTSNSHLAVSSDGKWLAVANRDNGSVTVVDLASRKAVREVAVGEHPESVLFVADGDSVVVSLHGADEIVFFERESGQVTDRLPVFDEPYGLCTDGASVYATLETPGELLEIDVSTRKIARTVKVGPMLRGIAFSARDDRIYLTEYLTGTVHALDRKTLSRVDTWPGASSENLARQIVVHERRGKAYVPHIRSRVNVNRGEGSVTPYVAVVDTAPVEGTPEGRRRKPLPMDSIVGAFVVANPWEVALSPDMATCVAVFAGTDDMFVLDVLDDDYKELQVRKIARLGHNPRAVRFSPDGSEFYVLNALDFQVAVFETASVRKLATIDVCQAPYSAEMLEGKRLFYTALEPMVGRRWISCSSCHPDGEPDGRTWQNPEGLRNTQSLAGMAWTHPIHWSADRDEVQDFEETIRGPLMQGRGLLVGRLHPGLGKPNSGLSDSLDALAVYSNSHKVPLSPFAKNGLSESAQRGRTLFFSAQTKCAECHSGPFFADSTRERPLKLHDVGTGAADPSEKMGPKYDTPTLLGLYRTAPYLHDGRAKSLEEVLTTLNPDNKHGVTSQLSPSEVADLAEFLRSLPYEDPVAAAKAAGMVSVVK